MSDLEKRLSDYIDDLNADKEPEKQHGVADNPDLEKLLATARLVRTLKEPAMPDSGYPQRLVKSLKYKTQQKNHDNHRAQIVYERMRQRRFMPVAAVATLAAVFLLTFALSSWGGLFKRDVVYAMEKAVAQLTNYHGVLEMRAQNAAGEEWLVRQVELWYEGDKYAVRQDDGVLTVNNGTKKWQVRPEKKEVALLPTVPDPMKTGFDLRDEAKRAKEYPHTVVDSETIAGREAIKLKISPPGGLPYYLWIDDETNLPIQLQTAMQNALETTYTFTGFEPNTQIDLKIFAYQPPDGYQVIEKDPGQLVATVAQAAAISGMTPLLPQEMPNGIWAFQHHIVLDYGDTTIKQTRAEGSFQPEANSALGTAAGNTLEVWWERLRWRQDGLEIAIEGSKRAELARQIAPDLTLPDNNKNLVEKAQVKVPVDMEVVKANQQQVDRGSSPWQLDPVQVAQTFVNLQVSPEGIQGEPQIPFASFKQGANNGVQTVIEVSDSPIKQVYLERLVRQDESGIWTVVGYDPR
ncbi:MAG: sigma-E factor regulatory protein RseB domain-containing protein [Desulfitobacteriaceae bacterium]|nr:sigma-E factor regulatory protein RseB domain-containing protein [Desulfitobacteriaceae bacterium]